MRKNNYFVLSIVLSISLVITALWGFTQYESKVAYRHKLNNQYQRYFYEMKDNIETVQTSLSKATLASSKEKNILLLSQIWQQANSAHEKLAQLPIRHIGVRQTERFLNQVSDYSFSLIQDLLAGKEMDDKQFQSLFKLQDYTTFLGDELEDTFNKVMKGDLDFNKLNRVESNELNKTDDYMLDTGLTKYNEEQLTEYPELIYDGPFSDQILNIKPVALGDKKVSEEEAKKIAIKFLDLKNPGEIKRFKTGSDDKGSENTAEKAAKEDKEVKEEKQKDKDEPKGANIDAYTFSIEANDGKPGKMIYIGVSKLGGKVIWAERPRQVGDATLSKEEAIKTAQKRLVEKGYKNMEPNYTETYNNTLLINFAYTQDDVTIYTDLIKIKIGLDTGQFIGFDAANYLKTHTKREISKPVLSVEEARSKVKYDFDVENVRLAIIPDRGLNELLCYEFKGIYKGQNFIVYINALNGREEKILRIIINKNGTLMM